MKCGFCKNNNPNPAVIISPIKIAEMICISKLAALD
jgi:hypothetical protein